MSCYKTTDGLMRHLRNRGIDIGGSTQKRQLINTGYFHGYKGYRFFNNANTKLPFTNYKDVFATIQYDSKLKSLFYSKIMYIETAVKNIALNCILLNAKSETLQAMYDKVVSSYNNSPVGAKTEQRKKYQENKLKLQKTIQYNILEAYQKDNPQITHFYNSPNYKGIPIWALFEIMTMGNFGYLLSCLTIRVREDVSKQLGINLAYDTDRALVYRYIYALKDLRNAIAHNSVVFDTRFRKSDPGKAMKKCLEKEMGLPYVNFKTIGDYVILMCYYLKMLHVPKTEIKAFIREFEKTTNDYKNSVDSSVARIVVHPDFTQRMSIIKNYI
nr:MAG TPA_asm: Abi-like protein [Caudoviricetes sp.]